eukprot:12169424-Prorocentrum_lima.AAC.1
MRFNHTVVIDLPVEADIEGNVYATLDIIDYATRYSMYELLSEKSAEHVAERFFESWCKWAD